MISYYTHLLQISSIRIPYTLILHYTFHIFSASQVVVSTASLAWGLGLPAHLVLIMGTQYHDTGAAAQSDYPVTDVLQMMGRATVPGPDETARCVLMCHTPKKEYYKKFVFEAFPVESHLDQFLHDHILAEVVAKSIENT